MMSCQNREIRYHKFTVLILKYGIEDFTGPGLLKIHLTLTGCCGFAFTNVPCIFPFSPNAWFNFTCYHSPGQPLGQLLPFGPGGGELFEAVLSQG